ncbi:MAG: hypothetical protein ACLQDL_00485 [Spirochaetia bacterium]
MTEDAPRAEADKIGGFLVAIGAMQAWQVEDVVLAQRTGDTRIFGEIAIALGYIDETALERFVESRLPTPAPCGTRPAGR